MRKKLTSLLLTVLLVLSLAACGKPADPPAVYEDPHAGNLILQEDPDNVGTFAALEIPVPSDFDGVNAWLELNENIPLFTEEEKTCTEAFETYSELDSLGRCGVAYANICPELMPTEDRDEIGSVKPSGWNQNKYDFVDGQYLYNRCHLIGFQLAGENANEKNLITGTRYLNIEGMLDMENNVALYVKETGNHVLYRVTPCYTGDNLLANGVLMEAWSVEDNGEGVQACIFAFNVQPGVRINYATGANELATDGVVDSPVMTYILNVNTGKFHLPACSSVEDISDVNKRTVTDTRDNILAKGYEPCGICNP